MGSRERLGLGDEDEMSPGDIFSLIIVIVVFGPFIVIFPVVTFAMSLVYLRKRVGGRAALWGCQLFRLHEGGEEERNDGVYVYSTCVYCGKAVMMNPQGDWFESCL